LRANQVCANHAIRDARNAFPLDNYMQNGWLIRSSIRVVLACNTLLHSLLSPIITTMTEFATQVQKCDARKT
jgi:hypothetical protein